MSVDVTKLPSGLTVVTDSMPHLETAALGVWAGVGGRDEKPNEHGISHLLEHMAFKGTTRRSSREIVEEIEAVGGDLNAGTSTETTAHVPSSPFPSLGPGAATAVTQPPTTISIEAHTARIPAPSSPRVLPTTVGGVRVISGAIGPARAVLRPMM